MIVVVERMSLDDDPVENDTGSPGLGLSRGMYQLSLVARFPTRSETNKAMQPQKVNRGLKFRI